MNERMIFMKRTINLFIIFFLSAVIITSNSTYIYAKKNNKYITRYNKIDTKAKKYIQKGYDCVIISESKIYFGKAYKIWDAELNYVYKQAKKTLPKKKFSKLKKSQTTWIKYRDQKAEKAFKEEMGGRISEDMRKLSLIKTTKKRIKWIIDKYLSKKSKNVKSSYSITEIG